MTILGEKFACEEVFIPELHHGRRDHEGHRRRVEAAHQGRGHIREPRGTVVFGTVARRHPRHRQGRGGHDAGGLGAAPGARPRHRRAGGEVSSPPSTSSPAAGHRAFGSAHLGLRLDEGDHRRHRRSGQALRGPDHDRRFAGGRAGVRVHGRRRLGPGCDRGAQVGRRLDRWRRRAEGGADERQASKAPSSPRSA